MSGKFVKRDRTARLIGVATLLYQYPHGLIPGRGAHRHECANGLSRLAALEEEVDIAVWQDGARYGAERTSFLPPVKLTLQEAVTLSSAHG